jgi:hypothetical protein
MGWHEPDKSRGLRPESVSGSGCKSPGRLGLGVVIQGPTLPSFGSDSFFLTPLAAANMRKYLSLQIDSPYSLAE